MSLVQRAVVACALAFVVASCPSSHKEARAKQPQSAPLKETSVPFVGCKAGGQLGPKPAPKEQNKKVKIDPIAAGKLAYYSAEDIGVLAPRNWAGFETYGSAGANLFVLPRALPSEKYFDPPQVRGPSVQASYLEAGTSGRFEVAEIIARVFPKSRKFVNDVIKEGVEPASSFPFGAYKKDQLKYLNDHVVEFTTPVNSEGMGTAFSVFKKNSHPIAGVIILDADGDNSLAVLMVRLEQDGAGGDKLTAEIVRQFEREHGVAH